MKSVNYIKKKLVQSTKPSQVDFKTWETTKFWAMEAVKAMSKGQFWSHKVLVPHSNCITWFMNEQGECTLGSWTYLEVITTPENSEVLRQEIEEFASQKEWFDAAEIALQLALTNNDASHFLYAGKLLRMAGLLKGALQILDVGLKEFPAKAALYAEKSQVFQMLGWIDQAIAQLDTALAFEPVTAILWRRRAELQWRLGQRKAALRSLKHACKLPNVRLEDQQLLASFLLKLGNVEEAKAIILSTQQIDPSNGINWLLVARLASATNEPVKFVKEYYHIARDLGVKNAQSELDYFLVRKAQQTRKRIAA